MADNTGLNFVDKHIEKVALGAGLLFLLIGVLVFLTGEKKVELRRGKRSKVYSIKNIDKQIDREGLEKINAIKSKKPKGNPTIKNYSADLARANKNPLGAQTPETLIDLGIAEGAGISIPKIEHDVSNIKPINLASFSKVTVAPNQAKMSISRQTVVERFGAKKDQYTLEEDNILHAACVLNLRKLQKAWLPVVRGTLIKPDRLIILPVDVEVQLQEKVNGKWVLAKRQDYRLRSNKTPPAIGGKDLAEVQELLTKYYRSNNGWAVFKLCPTYKKLQVGRSLDVDWKQVAPFMKEISKEFSGTTESTDLPKNTPDSEMPGLPPVSNDDRPENPAAGPAPVKGNGENELIMPKIPTFANQISLKQGGAGKVVSYVHFDNLEMGKEYRVRFRYVLVNPILAQDIENNIMKGHEKDVKVATITTPWSDWSKAGAVYRNDKFFVTYASKSGKKVNISIFTKILGQTVKAEIKDATVGRKIAKTESVNIQNPATGLPYKGKDNEAPEVDFNTGLTIVEINFSKSMLMPDGKRVDNAVEIIFADGKGNLYRRIESIDKNSAELKELEKEAENVSKSVSSETENASENF